MPKGSLFKRVRVTSTQKLIEKKQQHNCSSIIDNDNLVPGSIACFAKHNNSLKFIGSSSGAPYNSGPCRNRIVCRFLAGGSRKDCPARHQSSENGAAIAKFPCWKGTPLNLRLYYTQLCFAICDSNLSETLFSAKPQILIWSVGLEYNFLDERDYYFGYICIPQSSNPNHHVGTKGNSGYCNPERRPLLEGHTSCILV